MTNNDVNILFIVTTHAKMGSKGKETGLWLEELAVPYMLFTDAGAKVTIASLTGGDTPIDPQSIAPKGVNLPAVERFLSDPVAVSQLHNTFRLDSVWINDYAAVFLPGGHGTMWDTAKSSTLGEALSRAWSRGKIIAAVCHGPAGLITAKDISGKPLVAGRHVSAFTNSEETALGLNKAVPFLLENRLRKLGAEFLAGPDFEPYAVRDGNLITGQNPASSEAVARLVLEALHGEKRVAA